MGERETKNQRQRTKRRYIYEKTRKAREQEQENKRARERNSESAREPVRERERKRERERERERKRERDNLSSVFCGRIKKRERKRTHRRSCVDTIPQRMKGRKRGGESEGLREPIVGRLVVHNDTTFDNLADYASKYLLTRCSNLEFASKNFPNIAAQCRHQGSVP